MEILHLGFTALWPFLSGYSERKVALAEMLEPYRRDREEGPRPAFADEEHAAPLSPPTSSPSSDIQDSTPNEPAALRSMPPRTGPGMTMDACNIISSCLQALDPGAGNIREVDPYLPSQKTVEQLQKYVMDNDLSYVDLALMLVDAGYGELLNTNPHVIAAMLTESGTSRDEAEQTARRLIQRRLEKHKALLTKVSEHALLFGASMLPTNLGPSPLDKYAKKTPLG